MQPENEKVSMLVMLSGMVSSVSTAQPENAYSPMLVTVEGMKEIACFPAGHWISVVSALLYSTPYSSAYFWFPESTDIRASAVQSENALSPMLVTQAGMDTLLSAVHL